MQKTRSDIGLIGLGVMGQNLALNIADHGFQVSVYNRTTAIMQRFVSDNPNTPGGLVGCAALNDLVESLSPPRKVIMLVKAGEPTDAVIGSLLPLLQAGDMIIDAGNTHWPDTIRREKELAANGLRFIGSGISGGEEGARFGPSLMPGGDADAYKEIEPVWTAIAAKVDPQTGKPLTGAAPGKPVQGGVPSAAYIGPDGAGHYVKMVHNGIEYGDMQMIAEAYAILRQIHGLTVQEAGDIFAEWNTGVLDSFLIEITADILKQMDPVTGRPFIDVVLDTAGQKGTGKWTSVNALDMGVPAPTIAEAVFARFTSALKDERVAASKVLTGPATGQGETDDVDFVDAVHDALYCSKICAYAQGFELMRAAQGEYKWKLNFGEIASIWRGGCIIRARFLQKITEAYQRDPGIPNLLLDPYFASEIDRRQMHWRRVVACCAVQGLPAPTFYSALAYYDSYRSERLPASLTQAQRDFFGAHTYERVDQPRGKVFHLDWPDPSRPQLEA